MKKVTLFASAALIVASMTSCKKDYTCECTITDSGYTETYSATAHMKKKDAETWCSIGNETSGTYSEVCKLK